MTADAPGPGLSPDDDLPRLTDAQRSLRAQMLATEHWGLLAARSTAQSEVLTRITIFLTLVSAGLLTIGLLGQATGFDAWFPVAALAILGFLCLIGLLTQIRVMNVGEEDMMYVVAMNRLRGAYADLDPGIERYFLAALQDDQAGMERTYSFLRLRSTSHILGSSAILLIVVDACVWGLFSGGVAAASGASMGWAIAAGAAVGAVLIVASLSFGAATYAVAWRRYIPLRSSTEPRPFWRTGE